MPSTVKTPEGQHKLAAAPATVADRKWLQSLQQRSASHSVALQYSRMKTASGHWRQNHLSSFAFCTLHDANSVG